MTTAVATIFGREPETAAERAYVLRLASQELADARDMERSTGRFIITSLISGAVIFAVLTGAALLISASAGNISLVTGGSGPLGTIAVLSAAFTAVQVIRAPFRARKRRLRAREAARVPMQALAELADADDELNL